VDTRVVIVLTLFVIGAGYALRGPFPALLVYLWLAYFRPDHWVGWSILIRTIPMSYWVGVYLMAATVVSPVVKLRLHPQTWLALAFAAHLGISLALSPYVDDTVGYFYQRWVQSMLVMAVLTLLVTDRGRFRTVLIWMALSLSLDAAKQGWVGLITQNGAANPNDIPFLGDNNHVAVGVLMMAAMLGALVATTRHRWGRLAFVVLLIGMLMRSLQTYSRGGFLSIIALGLAGIVYSRRRLTYLVFASVVCAALFSVMPEMFWWRMSTIAPNITGAIESDQLPDDERESLDSSAQSRVFFWNVALRMAADRPFFGVGYMLSNAAYDDYDPSNGQYGRRRAIHSAWFATIAEGGYVGVLILLASVTLAFLACRRVRSLAKRHQELSELGMYAAGLNAALFTYIVGATFVGMQYSEMFWHFVGLTVCLARIAQEEAGALATGVAGPLEMPVRPVAAMGVPALARPPVALSVPGNRRIGPNHA